MKNTIKLFGIIAFVAVIGFTFAACDDGKSGNGGNNGAGGLNGTAWEHVLPDAGGVLTMTFTSNNTFTITYPGGAPPANGTYTVSGSTLTATVDGTTIIGTIYGNSMTLVQDGTTMVFTKKV
jgi:hypothetical protein